MMRMCPGHHVPGARTSRSSSPRLTSQPRESRSLDARRGRLESVMMTETTTIARTPAPHAMYCFSWIAVRVEVHDARVRVQGALLSAMLD